MKRIDIWNDVLRQRGISRLVQEAARSLQNLKTPDVMLVEVPDEAVAAERAAFEEIADNLLKKYGNLSKLPQTDHLGDNK